MNTFATVKAAVPITDASQRYGLTVDRHGKAPCPFHSEKTPSFRLYPDTASFYCFGCGAHGDVLDLTAHLLGLSGPLEAAKALNADFGLGLPMDGAPDPLAAHRRQTEQARLAAFEGWCKWACGVLIAYHRLLRRWRERYAPKAPEEQVHPRFVEALHMEAYVEYLFLSVFIDGDFETRASFYKTHQGEIVAYEQRCKVTAA